MAIVGVPLGLLVGAVPTTSMMVASLVLTTISVSKFTEAAFQNFAAGLILAAVASELFPLLLEDVSQNDTWIGVSIGFTVGLLLVFGLEPFVDFCSNCATCDWSHEETGSRKRSASGMSDRLLSFPDESRRNTVSTDNNGLSSPSGSPKSTPRKSPEFTPVPTQGRRKESLEEEGQWEEERLLTAEMAIAQPDHRQHLLHHLTEMAELINVMEEKANYLLNDNPSERDAEEVAEQIDEATHSLHYKLDHCKRLLQGSECHLRGDTQGPWVTEERKQTMKNVLRLLKMTTDHIVNHVKEETISVPLLKEIYEHMADMDNIITEFHDTVAVVSNKWIRRNRELPEPELGDKLPMKLVIPVTMDCFVDGFLIGVACALSPPAGIVLGFANCLEMAFLGMAYAARLKKCTGSSYPMRQFALYAPPLLMLAAAGFGAYIAFASRENPFIFVSFVSFGIVALLALVCGELLIEARESQGDEENFWIAVTIYAGIYLVIMLERVI